MALQIWMPFTDGTLKQQGLKDVSPTIGGTVDLTSVGKLGKCATIGTAAGGITLPASSMTSFTECSIAFWIKIISWNTSYATFFQAGLGSTPWNNYIFGILRNNAGSNLCFTLTNSSGTSSSAAYTTSNLNTGQWYHLAFTYKAGTISIYRDGVLDKTYSTTYVPNFAGITHISIGRSTNNSGYQTNCNLNDFRIYDHCLSPMEVKQLSQGLVLHYPLDRQGFGQENLLKNSHIKLDNNGYYVGTYSFANSEEIVTGETYTLSFNGELQDDSQTGWYFNIFPSPYTAIINKSTDKEGRFAFSFVMPENNGNHTAIGCYSTPLGNRLGCAIWNVKLEKGSIATPWCPNSSDTLATTMGLNSTTEYDCSGFCNNSTRNANTTYSSNTPKYSVSTFWGAVNTPKATLSDPSILKALNNCTVAWWENCTTTGNTLLFSGQTQTYYIGAGNSSNPLYDYNIGTSGITLYKDGVAVNTSYSGQRVNHTGTYHIKDEWHHYVLTGVNLSAWTTFIINGYGSWPLNAYVSDIRIYATALSAEDVKSLYQNCATIDPDGTIRGQIRS